MPNLPKTKEQNTLKTKRQPHMLVISADPEKKKAACRARCNASPEKKRAASGSLPCQLPNTTCSSILKPIFDLAAYSGLLISPGS